jgi:GNAT superfamily N-acetyltransferase
MSELPTRPNLDQLRRQARELQRAGGAVTLAEAQLAVARRYGFASWPRLKQHVESVVPDDGFVLRYVRTSDELRQLWTLLFTIVGADPDPERRAHWRVFERFDEQRHRMLVVDRGRRLVGGALGLHLLALEPDVRGLGLGRRLLEAAEVEAMTDGDDLRLHADPESTPFFVHLGYAQRGGTSGRHLYRGSPTSHALRHRRIDRWRHRTGDLDEGVRLTPDETTGKVPPNAW